MAKPTPAQEDDLLASAFDADRHVELARAVEQLSPDEAAFFLLRLEAAITKRKIQLSGYLAAMLVWLIAMTIALVFYGTHDGFVGWVFLLPFALVGATLYGFGRWADRVGRSALTPKPGAGAVAEAAEVVEAKQLAAAAMAANAAKAADPAQAGAQPENAPADPDDPPPT